MVFVSFLGEYSSSGVTEVEPDYLVNNVAVQGFKYRQTVPIYLIAYVLLYDCTMLY